MSDDNFVSKNEYQTRISWCEDRNKLLREEIQHLSAKISDAKVVIQQILITCDKMSTIHKEIYGNGDSAGIKSKLNFLSTSEERRNRIQTLLFTGFILNAFVIIVELFLRFH